MSKYIEADRLYKDITRNIDYCEDILEIVERQPAADVVEVRHGRWIIYPVSPWDGEDVKCSVCGEKGCAPYWDYCPHCGSQMVDVVSENEL